MKDVKKGDSSSSGWNITFALWFVGINMNVAENVLARLVKVMCMSEDSAFETFMISLSWLSVW